MNLTEVFDSKGTLVLYCNFCERNHASMSCVDISWALLVNAIKFEVMPLTVILVLLICFVITRLYE